MMKCLLWLAPHPGPLKAPGGSQEQWLVTSTHVVKTKVVAPGFRPELWERGEARHRAPIVRAPFWARRETMIVSCVLGFG